MFGKGCEPSWTAKGDAIYWVTSEKEVKHNTALMRLDVKAWKNGLIFDGDRPRGIDYFPSVNPEETHLLYGAASARRHYILGDYQLFLRDLKTGETAPIVTDSFNNRWPKFARLPEA